MEYSHTQKGYLHLVPGLACLVLLALALVADLNPAAQRVILLGAVVTGVATLAFAHLTVREADDHLVISFGPLPLFRRRVALRDIQAAEACRSDLLDGLGIHWLPRRGWIWNLWGTQCVRLQLPGRTLRVGTDDVDGLLAFLAGRLSREGA